MNIAITPPQLNSDSSVSLEAQRVHEALLAKGLETPMSDNGLSSDEKYSRIKDSYIDILNTLGLDLEDDSLMETPHRIAKMFVNEIFSGLDYSVFPRISVIENKMSVDEMVKVKGITFTST
jgi:GTP cyclohydrolase I